MVKYIVVIRPESKYFIHLNEHKVTNFAYVPSGRGKGMNENVPTFFKL